MVIRVHRLHCTECTQMHELRSMSLPEIHGADHAHVVMNSDPSVGEDEARSTWTGIPY